MNTTSFFRISVITPFLALIMSPPSMSAWQPDTAFGLDDAGQFAVLSLGKPSAETDGQSKLDLSAATVYGDVGVGPHGTLDFQGPYTIEGDLYIDQTLLPQDIISDAGTVTGNRYIVDLLGPFDPSDPMDQSGPVADAHSAADVNANKEPTQIFGRITTSTTLYSEGEENVIAVENPQHGLDQGPQQCEGRANG